MYDTRRYVGFNGAVFKPLKKMSKTLRRSWRLVPLGARDQIGCVLSILLLCYRSSVAHSYKMMDLSVQVSWPLLSTDGFSDYS